MNHIKTFLSATKNHIAALITFLIIWGTGSLFFADYIVPSPINIFTQMDSLVDMNFLMNLQTTLLRVINGFLIAFCLGTFIGFVSRLLKIQEGVQTALVLFQVIPGAVLGIVFLLIFGQGSIAPIALIITIVTPLIAINTGNSLMDIEPRLKDIIYSFGGNKWDVLKKIYLPSLVPAIKSNCTLGLSFSIKIVILGEFIASESGIGYLLNVSKIYFNMDSVFFYLLIIIAVMLVFQIIINVVFAVFFNRFFLSPEGE